LYACQSITIDSPFPDALIQALNYVKNLTGLLADLSPRICYDDYVLRPIHKAYCEQPSSQTTLALKLAERAIAVYSLMEYLCLHAILLLELNEDRSNAERFLVQIECTTQPADMQRYLQRMMSGLPDDDNMERLLSFSDIKRIPIHEAPDSMQQIAAQAKDKANKIPGAEKLPMVTFFFMSDEGRDSGAIFAAAAVFEWMLSFMASKPKGIVRSAMLGDVEVALDLSTLKE
jgi:hypothetical protein